MKISVKHIPYEKALTLTRPEHRMPRKCNFFWRNLIQGLTWFGMAGSGFTYETERMELLPKDQPCLILMNHSCFLDMQIVHRILYPRHFSVIATFDSFVGLGGLMNWVMHQIGGIPTQKFVTDLTLISDMQYCFKELKTSVLMYPEAGYSFDGTCTPLPRKMGVILKKLDVPVVMIETFGAFSRNPLYNELQVRKGVKVSAKATLLYTREEIKEKTVQELSDGLDAAFGFDNFKWQKENKVEIHDDFRADGLNRILYKCPHCGTEGKMEGRGIHLTCHSCGKKWELTPLGQMQALEGETEYPHIPDWYAWERECVRQEILDGTYRLDADVEIGMLVDTKHLYMVGEGHLTHDAENGFVLTGCDGKLNYTQKPQACYSVNADYYWYEIGDIISIGNSEALYYCFPRNAGDFVAKTRFAAEEMYKLYKNRRIRASEKAVASATNRN